MRAVVESVAFASVVLAVWSVPAASIAQTLTAEVRGAGDDADAAALRTQVSRAEGDLAGCMGTSARGRSETVLWLSVAATGEVTVALALHRGPAEGVGQCLVERMRSWRLHAGARRRIELVLRTGHAGGPTPAAPSARAVTPTRPPPPAPAVTPTRSTPPAPAAPPSRPPTTPPAARTPAPALPPSPAPAVPPSPAPAPPASPVPSESLPDVTVAYGPPSVVGPYSRADVQRIALRSRARLRRCYAEAVAAEPTLAGEVVIAFRIGTDGRTQSVTRDDSTLGRPALEHCFVRAVRSWRFGERADATTHTSVRLRLHLSPR